MIANHTKGFVRQRGVVAIYEGLDGEYKPPSNAVIYNADGSIQTILKMAVLESENILKKNKFQ